MSMHAFYFSHNYSCTDQIKGDKQYINGKLTCQGLKGVLRMNNGYFILKSVNGGLQKVQKMSFQPLFCPGIIRRGDVRTCVTQQKLRAQQRHNNYIYKIMDSVKKYCDWISDTSSNTPREERVASSNNNNNNKRDL